MNAWMTSGQMKIFTIFYCVWSKGDRVQDDDAMMVHSN